MGTQLTALNEPPCSLEHLKDRCAECGECWEWRAAYRADRYPVISFRRDWDGDGGRANRQFYVRHVVLWHKTGKAPVLGLTRSIVPTCGNLQCVNPDHLKVVSRRAVTRKTVEAGHMSTPTRRQNVAKAKRRVSKLSDEAVREIRNGDEPPKVAAARHGVTQAYIYMLRRGEFRRDFCSPFAGLGA